ncbi:hypothetical protein P280DRAFT_171618 [Massarina eburnea CBS 473.64]|uniref:Uncharacterized protein n=1 Tax=Massarina eburnea CBS 473.64 TaxID=1395130 RepID=A0A6A6SCJ8_9PLEO|nr:hypothetical protein P280DRAFT_171618 [Massarina eburnea CBS 473.64]
MEALNFALRLLSSPLAQPLPGFHIESIRNLKVVEPLIINNTLYYFLDYIFEGKFPHSGQKTTRFLLTEDEVPLQVKPYSVWAASPYNSRTYTLQERLLKAPDHCCVSIDRKTSLLRARLWMGLVPMSGGRWKEKRLDDWRNWQSVFEFCHEVLRVFTWLGDPDIQRVLQTHFNYVAAELEVFQDAINARRAQRNVQERVDLKILWLEFITSTFQAMVTRTHTWFHDRVHECISAAQAWYEDQVREHGAANSYQAAKKCGECWSDLSRLLNVADFTIMMSLDGFTGFTASSRDSKTVGSMLPLPLRQDRRKELEAATSWPAAEESVNDIEGTRLTPERFRAVLNEGIAKHEEIRKQMRGNAITLGVQHWITIIHSRTKWSLDHGGPQDQRWGLVAYLLTHTPTQEQWTAFLTRLYADFAKSGQWIEGFDEVKVRMDLQWIDGKSSGIPHDDIESAKRHFLIFRNSPRMRRRNWAQDFIVIDTSSFNSYMTPLPSSLPRTPPLSPTTTIPSQGDFGGFVKVIDLSPYRVEVIAETAPGFKNELKILGSLVFEELYPLLIGLCLRPKDLWAGGAMWHPQQVYVGIPTPSQEKGWGYVWVGRKVMSRAFAKLVERQTGTR